MEQIIMILHLLVSYKHIVSLQLKERGQHRLFFLNALFLLPSLKLVQSIDTLSLFMRPLFDFFSYAAFQYLSITASKRCSV